MMENVAISMEDRLNLEQIDMLEEIMKKCVDCIFNEYSEQENTQRDLYMETEDVFELTEAITDDLVSCFERSYLRYKKSVDVADNFEEAFFSLIDSNKSEVLRVLYPILFYSLILKNETGLETIGKRLQRESTQWGKTKNLLEIPTFMKGCSRTSQSGILLGKRFQKAKDDWERGQKGHSQKEHLFYFGYVMEDHIECAQSLLTHYLDIMQIQQAARHGLFVRDLLLTSVDESHPENTVIQMYIIDRLNGLISYIFENCGTEPEPVRTNGELLKTFIQDDGFTPEQIFQGHCSNHREKRIVFVDRSWESLGSFKELSLYLSPRKYISKEDVMALCDFFFPEEKLQWYTEYLSWTEQYVKTVIAATKNDMSVIESRFNMNRLTTFYNREHYSK